jgi:putative photosynthetic complex assembly protein
MTNRLKYHPGKLSATELGDRSLRGLANRYGPQLIIAFALMLAGGIIIDELRSGPIGSSAVVQSQDLVFEKLPDGTMAVLRDGDRSLIATLPSAEEGFVAMTIKGLVRERRKFNVAETMPYRLNGLQNGRLSLVDPVIGTRIELVAFGRTNIGSFAQLLQAATQPTKVASQNLLTNKTVTP